VIFFGLLALCNAASLGPRDTSNATVVCQSEDELWGGEDIRKFYFCLDGAVITDECDPGYYFVNNATIWVLMEQVSKGYYQLLLSWQSVNYLSPGCVSRMRVLGVLG